MSAQSPYSLVLGDRLDLPFRDSYGQADFPVAYKRVCPDVAADISSKLLFRPFYLLVIHGLPSFCGQGTYRGSLEFSGSLLSTVRSLFFRSSAKPVGRFSKEIQGRRFWSERKSAISESIVDTLVGVILISVVHGPLPRHGGGLLFFAQFPDCPKNRLRTGPDVIPEGSNFAGGKHEHAENQEGPTGMDTRGIADTPVFWFRRWRI